MAVGIVTAVRNATAVRKWMAAMLLLCAACGSSGSSSGSTDGPATAVAVTDNLFTPMELRVTSGTVVEWTNRGATTHNVVSQDLESLLVPAPDFGPGATYRYRFDTPGTYRYYCSLHGTPGGLGQQGIVVVS